MKKYEVFGLGGFLMHSLLFENRKKNDVIFTHHMMSFEIRNQGNKEHQYNLIILIFETDQFLENRIRIRKMQS